jgi:hypothetical protein
MIGNEIVEVIITSCKEGKISKIGLGVNLSESEYDTDTMPSPIYGLQELFRSVLRNLFEDQYRLDIIKREVPPDGLPH